jgi:predicted SprT family Zn-dependent metalloprotease
MKKALFCTKCFNDKDFKEINGQITHKIKEEKIKESVKKYICQNCGEEIVNDEEFDKSLLNAFEKYKDLNLTKNC